MADKTERDVFWDVFTPFVPSFSARKTCFVSLLLRFFFWLERFAAPKKGGKTTKSTCWICNSPPRRRRRRRLGPWHTIHGSKSPATSQDVEGTPCGLQTPSEKVFDLRKTSQTKILRIRHFGFLKEELVTSSCVLKFIQ